MGRRFEPTGRFERVPRGSFVFHRMNAIQYMKLLSQIGPDPGPEVPKNGSEFE